MVQDEESGVSNAAPDEVSASSANNDDESTSSNSASRRSMSTRNLPVARRVLPPQEPLEDQVRESQELQNDLPIGMPVDMEEERRRQAAAKRRHVRWIVFSIVLALLFLIGTVLGVTLRSSSAPPSSTTTVSPTPSPTSQDFASVQSLIRSVSLDGGKTLEDASSPQYRALEWLSQNEYLETYPDWRRIQRYALAVFFFATSGQDWVGNRAWLSDDDECTWFSAALDEICNVEGKFLQLAMPLGDNNNINGTIPKELGLLSNSLGE
jgi:hypothetical protein